MMKFDDLKGFIQEVVLDQNPEFSRAYIEPGPQIPDYPGLGIVLSRYGGPGLEIEGLFDNRAWQVRVIGEQDDYNSVEDLADHIDLALLSRIPGMMGSRRVLDVTRVGGSPSVLMYDDADRVHFVCSYVGSVQLALPT